ncbi:MAG: PilN domain-containing protein [Rubrivivax sp.]|nr:PilN domain-containing protein [Rubrivivax sp.]
MILINLLPHREAKRRQRKQAFFVGLAASALVGAVIVGSWYAVLGQLTAAQQARNDFLKNEIARLEAQIKDIATLRQEIEALKARQKAVEDLQTDRNTPVYLLDELVRQTPEGVYLTSIKQAGQVVTVAGVAQTNERVSELLRNTSYNSPWLERPELVEIKAANVTTANKEQRRLYEFQMRLSIKRAQAPAAAASAASAPQAAASAAGARPAVAAASASGKSQ